MEFLTNIFHTFLYQPIFNLLIIIYNFVPFRDFGLAVIILTLIFRFAFYPLTAKSIKSQKKMNEIQGKVKEIQAKYKDNKEKQVQETMALYKKENVSPLGGCLPMIAQLPILIAIYRVVGNGLNIGELTYLYSFVAHPGIISTNFLGIMSLSEPNMILAFLAGIFQFFQMKISMSDTAKTQGKAMNQMTYIFPIITVFILLKFPAILGLYWITTTIFSIGQSLIINKKKANV